jgi:ribosome recycling factor
MAEASRHILRGYRDDARKKIKHAIEAKEMSEDEKFRIEKLVDDETQKANAQIEYVKDKKEKEIMTV